MKKTKGFLLALALTSAFLLNGCGEDTDLVAPLPDQIRPTERLFIPNSGNGNVISRAVDISNANLEEIGVSAVGTTPKMVRTHPNQRYIYVANQGSDNISAFAVDDNGGLTPIAGSPFAAPAGATAIAIDPSGRFLYAAGSANEIRSYDISASGALSNPVNIALASLPTTVAPVFTRTTSGLFLNVAGVNGGVASVETFTVNETTGALTANSVSLVAGGTSVDGLSVHPTGAVLVASVEDAAVSSSSLLPFNLNNNGSLTQLNANQVVLGFDCGSVALSEAGIAYVGSDNTNNISAFNVHGGTGALTALANSPFAVGQLSNFVVVDPSNSLVYAVDSNNSRISGLGINALGELALGAGVPHTSQLVVPNLPDFTSF